MASIGIKEIAELSGVGLGTVSRVLNGTGPVSEKTRQKVMKVVQETGYVPNENARNLKLSRSNTIGLFMKSIGNPFYSKMSTAIYNAMDSRGYKLSVHYVPLGEDELSIIMTESMKNNLCGAIIMGIEDKEKYTEKRLNQLGIPCVALTTKLPNVDDSLYSSVMIDDENEGYKATKYLIEMGHRRIGFIYREPVYIDTPNNLRYKGYERALKESGIPIDKKLIALPESESGVGYKSGLMCMKKLLQKNPDMTAVFAFSDVLAVGAVKAVYMSNKRIPEDISIIGFDGIEEAEFCNPAIDTIYQPVTEMAMTAVSLLHGMINGDKGQHVICNSVIVKRDSVSRKDLR